MAEVSSSLIPVWGELLPDIHFLMAHFTGVVNDTVFKYISFLFLMLYVVDTVSVAVGRISYGGGIIRI